MPSRYCKFWKDQRGFVLVMSLILMGLLSALAGGYAMLVKADTVMRGGAGRVREGFYAAEAGLNVAMAETKNLFDDFSVPTAYSDTVTVGTGNHQRTVDYSLTPDSTCNPCPTQTIPAGQPFAGLNSIPYRYRVNSSAENIEGDQEAELGAEFEVQNIPIFQFLAFYANDLYIMPAEDMNLNGRIHTNGDLHLNINSGKTLSVGDLQPTMPFVQVSAGGNVYRGGYKDYTGQICTGTVTIDKLQDVAAPTPDLDPLNLSCVGSGSSPVSQATLGGYLGSLLADVNPLQVPDMSSIARGSGSEYWDKADLRIVLRLDLPRASINFSAADLCPGVLGVIPAAPAGPPESPALYPIEVQDASGAQNVTATRQLWRFMCDRRGVIFYNDVPDGAVAGSPNDTLANNRTSYTPDFGGTTNDRVYRRVGEDTNGDGVVDVTINGVTSNSDRNRDICPISVNNPALAAGTRPWWVMEDCFWPYEISGISGATGSSLIQDAPLSSWYRDMDYRRGGFYNRREGKWVYMLNANMRALIDWNEFNGGPLFAPNNSSDGGLVIFLSVQGSNSLASANNYGVRIFDSADLNTRGGTFAWPAPSDPTGLTVVSDQAIYVEGNYNTTHKYPAAVIGDVVNVLSQGWEVPYGVSPNDIRNDRKSVSASGNLTTTRDVPTADGPAPCGGGLACASFTTTTALGINAAFISGIGPSPAGDGVYNGGMENFPRFHESWTDRRLNYQGSLVSLGLPLHQNNDWACGSGSSCGIYDPPDRFWNYDIAFNNVAWLPPLTPRVTYVQQRLYTRFYK